jgi:hypothetical protein
MIALEQRSCGYLYWLLLQERLAAAIWHVH